MAKEMPATAPSEGQAPLLEKPARRRARSHASPRLWRAVPEWARTGQLLGVVLALGSAATLVCLLLTPSFRVQAVEVRGNRAPPSGQAVRESRALKTNLFLLDVWRVERRLREVPYVQRVRVERILPNRVRLTIEERFPSVSWCNSSSSNDRYLVDDGGLLVAVEQPDMPELIYVVDVDAAAAPLKQGGYVDAEAVRAAQRIFSRLYNDLEIALFPFEYEAGRGLTAVSADGWRACFGTAERLEEKVNKLAFLLQSGIEFIEVDLRQPNQLYYY